MQPDLTLTIALIAGSGILAQWLAWRLRWPSIVLMMGAGLLLGPVAGMLFGAPVLNPQASFQEYLRPMIALAVAVILFEGGITLNFRELRDASAPVRRMVFLGYPLGWAMTAAALHYVAGLAWDIAFMIGALLTTTGPTVVLPLLRQAKLPGRIASVLKWEGIVNDPIGALCAVFMFEAIRQTAQGHDWVAAAGFLTLGALVGGELARAAFEHGFETYGIQILDQYRTMIAETGEKTPTVSHVGCDPGGGGSGKRQRRQGESGGRKTVAIPLVPMAPA